MNGLPVAIGVVTALVGAGYILAGVYTGAGAWLAGVGFGASAALIFYVAHYLTTIGATWGW